MSDTLYVADPGDSGEFSFADFVARLGVSVGSPATFLHNPEGDLPAAWEIWQQTWLVPVLAPAFVEIYRLGANAHVREIGELDQTLDRRLSPTLRTRSLEAAAPFFEGKTEMQGHREWKKFTADVASGKIPGHVTSVFALHSVLYRLPLLSSLSAYCWFEFRSGSPRNAKMDADSDIEIFNTVLPHLAVAVYGDRPDCSDGPGTLRAI